MSEFTRLALVPVEGQEYDGPARYSSGSVGDWLVRRLRYEPYELVGVLSIDRRHRIFGCTIVYRGIEDRALVEPQGILAPPLLYGAPRCAIFHNHPSDTITPSSADEEATKRLLCSCRILGLELEDHLIIGRTRWGSMALHALRRPGGFAGLGWDGMWRARDGRSVVQPKYRHPETGETWAGRGSLPKWLLREKDAGRDLGDFRVRPGRRPRLPRRRPRVPKVRKVCKPEKLVELVRNVTFKQ